MHKDEKSFLYKKKVTYGQNVLEFFRPELKRAHEINSDYNLMMKKNLLSNAQMSRDQMTDYTNSYISESKSVSRRNFNPSSSILTD